MKKIISYKIFVLCFAVLMLLNSITYLQGYINPNINDYSLSFIETIFFIIGNISIPYLIIICAQNMKKEKTRKRFLLSMSFILCFYIMVLSILANILNFPFSFKQLTSFQNEGQSNYIKHYISFIQNLITNPSHYLHLLSFVILLILAFFTNFETHKVPLKKHFLSFSFLITIPLLFTLIFTFHSPKNSSLYKMKTNGVYNFMLYDLIESTMVDKLDITNDEYQKIYSFLTEKENKEINDKTGLLKNQNLIILQMEQINNLCINLIVDGIEIMPNLSNLAKKYTYFNNYFSSSGAGNTSDAEMTNLTGIIGNGNDLSTYSFKKNNFETLAKDFKNNNYYTYGAIGFNPRFYNRDKVFIDRYGFDDFYGKEFYTGKTVNDNIGDYEFLEQSLKIHENKEKFFGYWILSTSHMPYINNEDICLIDFNTTKYMSNYLNYCIYVDKAIGNLVKIIEEQNLTQNTTFVFYGDHTPSLFKQDIESIEKYKGISKINYQRLMCNVPFVMVNDKLQNIKDESVHSFNDTYQTLSNLFGLNSKYSFGTDMFSNEQAFYYNPRNSLTIYDDVMFTYSNKKFYPNSLTKEKKNKLYNEIINYKTINDLILFSDIFR